MRNPFKKKQPNSYEMKISNREVLTGDVEFVYNNTIMKGRIFGRPIAQSSIFTLTGYTYYVRSGNKVYKIAEEAIEKL